MMFSNRRIALRESAISGKWWRVAIALVACGWYLSSLSSAQEALPLPPSVLEPQLAGPDQQDDLQIEELARGPVHEAFAEHVSYDPVPGIIVPKAPPEPIREMPPEFAPEGEGWVFIGGYWFWDDTRDDFIWISGGYRQLPPDTVWIDGYWHEVEGGWQRVSGFYSLAENRSIAYHRTPPASLENGPIGPAPSEDHIWSPGYWAPYESEFVWRPGYWQVCRPGWVWVPRFWRWTPRGCVLAGGYWDHPWDVRGHCFAPVYFHRPVYLDVGWSFRPRVLLRHVGLRFHWFVRPYDCHYYFGDWYGVDYFQRGFIPGYQLHARSFGIGYDPCFVYDQWHYRRQGVDFLNVSIQWNRFYTQHAGWRPPRTFVAQQNFVQNIQQTTINNVTINNINNTVINQTILADSLQQVANQRGGWRRAQANEVNELTQVVERSRQVQRERAQAESASMRLASVRSAGNDPAAVQQLEQLAREQQRASREARQRAADSVAQRLSTEQETGGRSARSGWNPSREPQRSDGELVRRLERQLPQVAIGEQSNRAENGGRTDQVARAGNPRSIELTPPRASASHRGHSGAQDGDEPRARGAGWRSLPEVPGNNGNATPRVTQTPNRGLTPLPDIDRTELERRARGQSANQGTIPGTNNRATERGTPPHSGIDNVPQRGSSAGAPNNAGNPRARGDAVTPPSVLRQEPAEQGRGAGWQERGRTDNSPPAGRVNQGARGGDNSGSGPGLVAPPAPPRSNPRTQIDRAPQTNTLPAIDRAELERRAAGRGRETGPQVVPSNPNSGPSRAGWNAPRGDNSDSGRVIQNTPRNREVAPPVERIQPSVRQPQVQPPQVQPPAGNSRGNAGESRNSRTILLDPAPRPNQPQVTPRSNPSAQSARGQNSRTPQIQVPQINPRQVPRTESAPPRGQSTPRVQSTPQPTPRVQSTPRPAPSVQAPTPRATPPANNRSSGGSIGGQSQRGGGESARPPRAGWNDRGGNAGGGGAANRSSGQQRSGGNPRGGRNN